MIWLFFLAAAVFLYAAEYRWYQLAWLRRNHMLLSDDEIKKAKLVEGAVEANYRAASYDVSVGRIITPDGNVVEQVRIQPQGIVEVISRERLHLPSGVAGQATVKTSLCNEGILPLNIGVIDPQYDGYVSSTLLNFGNRPYHLFANEVFLRITFQTCTPSTSAHPIPAEMSDDDYVNDKKRKMLNFSTTFLNLESRVRELTEEHAAVWRRSFYGAMAAAGTLLVVATFLLTIGIDFTGRHYWGPKQELKSEIEKELAEHEATRKPAQSQVETQLQDQIDKLKAQIKDLQERTPTSPPKQSGKTQSEH